MWAEGLGFVAGFSARIAKRTDLVESVLQEVCDAADTVERVAAASERGGRQQRGIAASERGGRQECGVHSGASMWGRCMSCSSRVVDSSEHYITLSQP